MKKIFLFTLLSLFSIVGFAEVHKEYMNNVTGPSAHLAILRPSGVLASDYNPNDAARLSLVIHHTPPCLETNIHIRPYEKNAKEIEKKYSPFIMPPNSLSEDKFAYIKIKANQFFAFELQDYNAVSRSSCGFNTQFLAQPNKKYFARFGYTNVGLDHRKCYLAIYESTKHGFVPMKLEKYMPHKEFFCKRIGFSL